MSLMGAVQEKKILVVGDIMLDQYYLGTVERISPEAPVPVFLKKEIKYRLGGAANVALNLAVNGQNVNVLSVIGEDENGAVLKALLQESHIAVNYLISAKRPTSVKTRLLAGNNQQVLRIDTEETADMESAIQDRLLETAKKHVSEFDIVVVSDYKKGVLSHDLSRKLFDICRKKGVKTLADVKDSRSSKYFGAFLIKPNRGELARLTKMPVRTEDEIKAAAVSLCKRCESSYVLATCGAQGMILTDGNGVYRKLGTTAREVYDVTGAGDTVIAYMAMCLASDMSILHSMEAANIAAGIQVSKAGTSSVQIGEVENFLSRKSERRGHSKLLSIEELSDYRKANKDKKIVFTNGCFDILHIGHLRYLKQASEMGDIFIVGLNSDASVQRLKGAGRPVNQEEERAEMLSCYDFIDYIVIFEEDTPYRAVAACEPDILVKGGDYTPDEVAGRDIVLKKGGCVKIIPYVDGKSTSQMIAKIEKGRLQDESSQLLP